MTEIQGKSILVRVSERFELARVRVIGSQLYTIYHVVCSIVCFLLKLGLITTSFTLPTLPVKYSFESSELTPLPEKKKISAQPIFVFAMT